MKQPASDAEDFLVLADLHDRWRDAGDMFSRVLAAKTGAARVIEKDDIPADVATLNSRVTFNVRGADVDTCLTS